MNSNDYTIRLGQTILLFTHDEKIAQSADRIITIGDGRIVKGTFFVIRRQT